MLRAGRTGANAIPHERVYLLDPKALWRSLHPAMATRVNLQYSTSFLFGVPPRMLFPSSLPFFAHSLSSLLPSNL